MAGRNGVYEWKHNWIPLTHRAALLKAKGNRKLAERMVPSGPGKGARKLPAGRSSTVEDRHRERARNLRQAAVERQASAELRQMSDDRLADHLANVGDDDAAVERVLAELDRRDKVAAAAQRRTEARNAARAAKEARQDAAYDRALAAGDDPQEAYERIFGVSVERQRRDEAISSLRSAGYRGRNFDELVRSAYRDHTRQSYQDAEAATNGYLVNKAGDAAGVHPATLFTGPEVRARKYASRELLDYWQAHGRLTVDDFKASLLGGHMRSASTAAFA